MADLAFGVAETVLVKLASKVYEELGLANTVKDDLKKLEETASDLKFVLEDAEKKQEQNADLKRWLIRLKDVLHDAVDVLDEFECEALRRQVVKEYGSVARKVRRFFSRSNPLAFRLSIAHRIKEVGERLDEIAKEMARFQLIRAQLSGPEEQSHFIRGTREMTHSFVHPSEVIGRDADKTKIINMLINKDKSDGHDLSVIPIVGLGGLGKTTLAKSVYNDQSVVQQFDLRLWVCLPLDFNFADSTREILKSAISAANMDNTESFTMDKALRNTKDLSNLSTDQLQMFLRGILKDKKIFLVLDDVWNEDRSKWNEVRGLLLTSCAKGSKILVTTRSTSVASVMATTPQHNLASLSEKDALSLFLKYAFENEQLAEKSPKLRDIGMQIVEKCKGVPLALKSLGSLLYLKTDEREWIFLRDSEIWELKREYNDPILSALRISYSTMPPHLKQCFPFCSLIPKNSRGAVHDLIWKWMALGVVTSPNERMELEDVGHLCFEELCARSFFQYLEDTEEFLFFFRDFEMHDLINDLAMSIIQHDYYIINSDTTSVPDSVKHLTICLKDGHGLRGSRMLHKSQKLHSIILMCETDAEVNIDESILSNCISRFRYLRLLDFANSSFEVLPNCIGSLKHLRYLNLSDNKRIKNLPNSICNLQSLQTLLLIGCKELEELPRDIRKLISLRTLAVTMKKMCFQENGIGRLKSLRSLMIYNCENLKSLPHDIRNCTTLRTLIIIDCEQIELASKADESVMQLSLRTLLINELPETTALPHWLQGAAHTLQHLAIKECPKLAALPEWFPNLTSLQVLGIGECPKLQSLPEGMQRLTSLTKLKITDCNALEERCKREVGEDWSKIAHVPNISIGSESDSDD